MHERTLVRVFVDDEGRHGNPLTIIDDASSIQDDEALAIAAHAGTSETVFVDDAACGRVRIFVPRGRVAFAGHPLVGVAAHLHRQGHHRESLLTDSGIVSIDAADDRATVVAHPGRGAAWLLDERRSLADVLRADASGEERHDYVWAWRDESLGLVRARAFTSASGTVEDEATGSAAVELCAVVGRPLNILQGAGSQITVRPCGGDRVALTGGVSMS